MRSVWSGTSRRDLRVEEKDNRDRYLERKKKNDWGKSVGFFVYMEGI